MAIFRISKAMLYDVTGMGSGTMDETVISTINVRLDEMFREAILHCNHVIRLHGDDLEKLAHAGPKWRESAKTLQTPRMKFTAEQGISDQMLRDVNYAPKSFAQQIETMGRLAFCQSPMFEFKRVHPEYEMYIWMHVVFEP